MPGPSASKEADGILDADAGILEAVLRIVVADIRQQQLCTFRADSCEHLIQKIEPDVDDKRKAAAHAGTDFERQRRGAAAAAAAAAGAAAPGAADALGSVTELVPSPKGLPETDFASKRQCQLIMESISERLSGETLSNACAADAGTSPELAAMVLSTLSKLLKDPVVEGLVTKAVVSKVQEAREAGGSGGSGAGSSGS